MTFVVVCIELNVSTVVVSLVSVHCQENSVSIQF